MSGDYNFWLYNYRCTKLIYWQHYCDIRDAIARETEVKKWKKIALINRLNPSWLDLSIEVLQDR
ncbi:MAG: hypothetical protein DMF25_04040 [Verrucomicrobia bacterium]|nr:MAG: hypothetical protein DMF25_04040 [Verrucomicrobiota bacterium]